MHCPRCNSVETIKKGFFFVVHSRTYIRRYSCLTCRRTFSSKTNSTTYKQKKPFLNAPILNLMMNGCTQRGTARILKCSKHTIEKKLLWLRQNISQTEVQYSNHLQIDAMESIEHTKLKPLTIPLCVDENYKIVAVDLGRMNAKGHLAKISIRKYGLRPNEVESSLRNLLRNVRESVPHPITITTDSHPLYPKLIKEFFPSTEHIRVTSRDKIKKHKELVYTAERKNIFDPMFALNQRCAMLRADLRRLTRRSWCTTKNIDNLKSQLELYRVFNNQKLHPV